MSLRIIKAGISDTIQDTGRYGWQNAGINPGGAMDRFSARLANALLGKELDEPVIELHFYAPAIQFDKATIICIAGADFSPTINTYPVPLHQPVAINSGALLEFKNIKSGGRCYLSTLHNLKMTRWLGSYSTNMKAKAGGFHGRPLTTGDEIHFKEVGLFSKLLSISEPKVLGWGANPVNQTSTDKIEVIRGSEWQWLSQRSQEQFTNESFIISNVADRMGYRLKGVKLEVKEQKQLVSCGVTFGTVQLLPNGQLVVLMADHPTTGGYPRIANVISAHLPSLAQKQPEDSFFFTMGDIEDAEQKLWRQYQYLTNVQTMSALKMEQLLA